MANKVGYFGAIDSAGAPIAETYVDNGDGTYSRKVTTTNGAGVTGYRRVLDSGGAAVPLKFVAQGDGTYAELVSAS